MEVFLTIIKLVILSALFNPHSVIPVQVTITNVHHSEVPFNLQIDFKIYDPDNNPVYNYTVKKYITTYKPAYSGTIYIPAKIPPGSYRITATVIIDNRPLFKLKQNITITDGININIHGTEPAPGILKIKLDIGNTGGQDENLIILGKIYNEKGEYVDSIRDVVYAQSGETTTETLTYDTAKLPSGKYTVKLYYSISGYNYQQYVGEVSFTLQNNTTNLKYYEKPILFLLIIMIIIIILSKK